MTIKFTPDEEDLELIEESLEFLDWHLIEIDVGSIGPCVEPALEGLFDGDRMGQYSKIIETVCQFTGESKYMREGFGDVMKQLVDKWGTQIPDLLEEEDTTYLCIERWAGSSHDNDPILTIFSNDGRPLIRLYSRHEFNTLGEFNELNAVMDCMEDAEKKILIKYLM